MLNIKLEVEECIVESGLSPMLYTNIDRQGIIRYMVLRIGFEDMIPCS